MNKAEFFVMLASIQMAPHMSLEWAVGFSLGCCLIAGISLFRSQPNAKQEG